MSKKILEAGGKQYEVIEGSRNCHRYCMQCQFWKQSAQTEPCFTCMEDYCGNQYNRIHRPGRILKPIE